MKVFVGLTLAAWSACFVALIPLAVGASALSDARAEPVETIATGLANPRAVAIAPGERILSAAAGAKAAEGAQLIGEPVGYVEDSGTSMAAPHVSGVIAAFLSIRREYIGRPEQVKDIFTSTATDLGRVPDFQGHGLIDAMRAIQSV